MGKPYLRGKTAIKGFEIEASSRSMGGEVTPFIEWMLGEWTEGNALMIYHSVMHAKLTTKELKKVLLERKEVLKASVKDTIIAEQNVRLIELTNTKEEENAVKRTLWMIDHRKFIKAPLNILKEPRLIVLLGLKQSLVGVGHALWNDVLIPHLSEHHTTLCAVAVQSLWSPPLELPELIDSLALFNLLEKSGFDPEELEILE